MAIVLSSSGAASASATNPAITSGVAGRTSRPPTTVSTGWSRYFRRVTTPKLPPPPRSAQNSSGSVSCVHAAQPPVGGDDLRREQVVDGQPVLAHEEADAAGERDAADPDGARVAEAGREPVLARRDGVRAGGEARARPDRAPGGIELERAQRREVDHDAAVADAVARGAVAAAADRELGSGLAGVGDDAGDVVGARDAGDERGAAVDVRGEDGPRLVVGGVLRGEDPALEVWGQPGSGEHRPGILSCAAYKRNSREFLCAVQDRATLIAMRKPAATSHRGVTRQAVAEAAADLVAADGLEALSVRQVANRLGVWPTTVMHHAGGRRDGLLTLLIEHLAAGIRTEPTAAGGHG